MYYYNCCLFLTQGALYSREIFQEWMINNTKFYLIDGFAETLTGGKSKKDFYGEASNTSDDEKGGKLWIDEPRETEDESSHIPIVKGEITSKNNIIIYFCIIILCIVGLIYKSRRNKEQLLQDKTDEKPLPFQMYQSPIGTKK